MAITGFNESSLATSEVFQGLAKLSGSDPKEKAINLIRTAKKLTNEDIEAAYIQLKQYSNGLSIAALRAFDDETIILRSITQYHTGTSIYYIQDKRRI